MVNISGRKLSDWRDELFLFGVLNVNIVIFLFVVGFVVQGMIRVCVSCCKLKVNDKLFGIAICYTQGE